MYHTKLKKILSYTFQGNPRYSKYNTLPAFVFPFPTEKFLNTQGYYIKYHLPHKLYTNLNMKPKWFENGKDFVLWEITVKNSTGLIGRSEWSH